MLNTVNAKVSAIFDRHDSPCVRAGVVLGVTAGVYSCSSKNMFRASGTHSCCRHLSSGDMIVPGPINLSLGFPGVRGVRSHGGRVT